MLAKAVVSRVSDEVVSVILCPQEACTNCAACRAFDRHEPEAVRALDRRGLKLKPGDLVEIYLPPWKTVRAGFLVLIFPLLLFFAVYLAAGGLGVTGEGLRVVLGAGGLALGFMVNYLRRGNTSDLPEIVRVGEPPAQ